MSAPRVWNSLPLGLKTKCDSLRGFKTGLKTSARTITIVSATQRLITVISLELWRFINYHLLKPISQLRFDYDTTTTRPRRKIDMVIFARVELRQMEAGARDTS